MRRYRGLLYASLAVTLVTACGTENSPTDDLSDQQGVYDHTGWTVVANFDEFPNIGYRCIGSDKVYSTTRIALPLVVVPNSPDCRDGGS